MSKKAIAKNIAAVLLIVLGLALCLNTLLAHQYSSDWNFGVVLPAVMGLGCFLYALKLLIVKRHLIRNKRLRTAIIVAFILCLLFFISVEAFIIMDPLIHRSELAGRVDYLVVLGCGIWPDGRPTHSLVFRLDKAIEYYEENPHITLIVSGGKGPNEPFSEALAMEDYLQAHGIPGDKIIKEDRSTSTKENFEFSRKLMNEPSHERVKIVFVTNDFHILRSRILARRFGFEAHAISAPTPAVITFNSYLREFFAFVKSMLVDY
ncbi:MAG TPA: YdcF family protein [Ruminiclostridium sp.]|jgi:uncharacterized SAM-binding protein YcdF (DUF218 family)|nr:YdcF family protein [Ruminiclostridium sp.]